jgi:hypothetical protein
MLEAEFTELGDVDEVARGVINRDIGGKRDEAECADDAGEVAAMYQYDMIDAVR